MLSYTQLRSWRSLCEFLNEQPYKFALPETLDKAPIGLRKIYAFEGSEHRHLLRRMYRISFIRWGEHPLLSFSQSRRVRREHPEKGWILVPGWEAKVHFLEQVYLLNHSSQSLPMPWHEAAKRYDLERTQQHRQRIKYLKAEHKRAVSKAVFRVANNRCWFCNREMIPLMVDCLCCGHPYDGYEALLKPGPKQCR